MHAHKLLTVGDADGAKVGPTVGSGGMVLWFLTGLLNNQNIR